MSINLHLVLFAVLFSKKQVKLCGLRSKLIKVNIDNIDNIDN